jgi:hypothetical protein
MARNVFRFGSAPPSRRKTAHQPEHCFGPRQGVSSARCGAQLRGPVHAGRLGRPNGFESRQFQTIRRRKTMTRAKILVIASAALAMALGLAAAPASIPSPFLNLSGYEFLLGTTCTIGGLPSKCGVSFLGWSGGKGPGPDGWTAYPGNTQGLWESTINYIGSPAFGSQVGVAGGVFDLLFKHKPTISGVVTGGSVTWPTDANTDIGCGAGVATASLTLNTGSRGPTSFQGCLHDLPAGSVIPPRIWGTLQ